MSMTLSIKRPSDVDSALIEEFLASAARKAHAAAIFQMSTPDSLAGITVGKPRTAKGAKRKPQMAFKQGRSNRNRGERRHGMAQEHQHQIGVRSLWDSVGVTDKNTPALRGVLPNAEFAREG